MNIKPQIKIHPLLIPQLCYFIYYEKISFFFMILFFVTIHELSHCIMGLVFGVKVKQILITPIGERAILEGLENLTYYKRQMVLLIGPAVSVMIGIILFFLEKNGIVRQGYAMINFTIGIFNSLPFLPMDGGAIFLNKIGNKWGRLKIALLLTKTSKGFGYFLIFMGIIQLILYPFNVSLIVIGFYFVYCNKREYLKITYQTYQVLLSKKNGMEIIRDVMIHKEITLGELVKYMNTDEYFIFYYRKNGILKSKSQDEIMEELMKKGQFQSLFSIV